MTSDILCKHFRNWQKRARGEELVLEVVCVKVHRAKFNMLTKGKIKFKTFFLACFLVIYFC
jgi:hypothetical protein